MAFLEDITVGFGLQNSSSTSAQVFIEYKHLYSVVVYVSFSTPLFSVLLSYLAPLS